jgi:hypothetical protein
MMVKKAILIAFILCSLCKAQSISPSVINAGGRTTTATLNSQTVIYTDNIGETVIGTGNANGKMITQGFLQPDFIVVNNTTVTVFASDVTCGDKQDGFIRVDVASPPPGANIMYYWTPNSLCPTNDCQRIDSLTSGTFTVVTKWTYTTASGPKADSARHVVSINNNNGPCNIKVYSGIILSGTNNKFTIDNIELYPKAKVCIFSRWGAQMFCTQNYSNDENYWPRKGEKVLPGTYFYIIDAGEKGVIKSWVEVLE